MLHAETYKMQNWSDYSLQNSCGENLALWTEGEFLADGWNWSMWAVHRDSLRSAWMFREICISHQHWQSWHHRTLEFGFHAVW